MKEAVLEHAAAWDFHQAVRVLEAEAPDRPRVGASRRRREDIVHFGQRADLAFPTSSIEAVTDDGSAVRMLVRFLGCFGPQGPMPLHFTETVLRRRVSSPHDRTTEAFLDVFHDRIVQLYYRAWAQASMTASRDRPDEDRFGAYLSSLAGTGLASQLGRDAVPDDAKRFAAGRLEASVRDADGLEDVLADDLGVSVEIIPFLPRRITLPDDCLCRLGESPETGLLGETVVVGSSVVDVTQVFGMELGPMGLETYVALLPGGALHRRLRAWVLNWIGRELGWEARIWLREDEVPTTRLGADGPGGRLGMTTWLGVRSARGHAGDYVLRGDAA